MSYSYGNHQNRNDGDFPRQRNNGPNNFRGGRNGGNRDTGGFRIRLSDNEMRAARSIQEAFNLRSTVAVLGFALRTLAGLLEEGKLEEFLNEYRAQAPSREKRKENEMGRNRFDQAKKDSSSLGDTKPNPFARPDKPESNNSQVEPNEQKQIDPNDNLLEGEEEKEQNTNVDKEVDNNQSIVKE